jgi:glycosyltransferase involved in cell wall biosynthesis
MRLLERTCTSDRSNAIRPYFISLSVRVSSPESPSRMTDGHFVTVVVPCHNAAPFIADTIQSVLDQTRAVDEIVVVDDGSSDGSAAIAESFGEPVRVIRQPNRGECAARNRGVQEARGDIIAFLDADDLWHPEKIERQLACFDAHPEVGAVMTSVAIFEHDTRASRPFLNVNERVLGEATPRDMLAHWLINQSAIAVRGEIARSTPYPDGIADSGDMIQSVELRMKTEIGAVPEVLAFYRQHERQVTKRANHNSRSLKVRMAWGQANFRRMGESSVADALQPLLAKAVDRTMSLYWAREITRFKRERDQLIRDWPQEVPIPKELTRLVLPRAVLVVSDRFDQLSLHVRK